MIQIQSILLPEVGICQVSDLYFHQCGDRINFDGYFNLIYLEKRKKYTDIDNLKLSLRLRGYSRLIVCHDRLDVSSFELEPEKERNYCFELPYGSYDTGVFWFALIVNKDVSEKLIQGFYMSDMDTSKLRMVNIGIDICTYCREEYVDRNLRQLKRRVLENDKLDVCGHVKVYIIDNGKTLETYSSIKEMEESSDDNIRIIKNKNTGGAGGFTRGMLEVLNNREENDFTHVLLMDDDAVIEPDILVRIFGILSTLKNEWKDVTIGGALWREDFPYILYCAGERWENGKYLDVAKHFDLRKFDVASNHFLTSTGKEFDVYSGWWCCCYSLKVVREDNLPIPLFLHHDDVEFCLRNQASGFVFFNGIGVWHKGFDLLFQGANCYYDTRNGLIELALNGSADGKKRKRIAKKMVFTSIIGQLFKMRYKENTLIYQGVIDFLKGPDWLFQQDAEELHSKVRARICSMKPFQDMKNELTAQELESIERQIEEGQNRFKIMTINGEQSKKIKAKLLHYLTFNGWFLPADDREIKVLLSTDSPFEAFRKKKLLLYEMSTGKTLLARRKYTELFKALKICCKVSAAVDKYFDAVVLDYQRNITKFTNKRVWEEYLKD